MIRQGRRHDMTVAWPRAIVPCDGWIQLERSTRKHWCSCETRLSDALPLQEIGQYRVQQRQLPLNLIVGINAASSGAAASTNHLPACLNTLRWQ
jgi:hypothetical protein